MEIDGARLCQGFNVHLHRFWDFHSTRADAVPRELALIYIAEGH
jgi:hypothetical protein